MKIGSFEGIIPTSRLPDNIREADIAELLANLIGISAKDSLSQCLFPTFSFLLTGQLSQQGLRIGLSCHIKPFYESFKRLLILFFDEPQVWKSYVESLPPYPTFSGSIRLGMLVPHRLVASPSTIHFESSFTHLCKASFPTDTSSVLTWLGCAANSAIIHFDLGGSNLSPDESRLIARFSEAMKTGELFALDELSIDESNPEAWTWAK